jgi:predicted flap endonuclease-1-like 5' DNA nuclease
MKALVAAEAVELRQLPNIGPAMIGDFKALGIARPAQLAGKDPYALYRRLC